MWIALSSSKCQLPQPHLNWRLRSEGPRPRPWVPRQEVFEAQELIRDSGLALAHEGRQVKNVLFWGGAMCCAPSHTSSVVRCKLAFCSVLFPAPGGLQQKPGVCPLGLQNACFLPCRVSQIRFLVLAKNVQGPRTSSTVPAFGAICPVWT